MVAVRVHTERKMELDRLIRRYIIGDEPLSPRVSVYTWRYIIRDELVIARDIVLADARTPELSGILNVIKFYPISAVVQLDGKRFDAPSFAEFSGVPTSEQLELTLQFSTPFHPLFPEESEQIDPHYMVTVGRGFSDGIQRDRP
jgi:hypothetical protein